MLGLAVLTRPVAQYLPLVLVPVLLLLPGVGRRRTSLVLSAALLVGFAIPVGGWLIRNHERTSVATISTIDGYDMLHYRAVGALVESGMTPSDARGLTDKELAPLVHHGDNAAEVSRIQLRLGLRILRAHPVDAAKSWARGIGKLLVGPARSETSILLTGKQSSHASWFRALVLVDALITIGDRARCRLRCRTAPVAATRRARPLDPRRRLALPDRDLGRAGDVLALPRPRRTAARGARGQFGRQTASCSAAIARFALASAAAEYGPGAGPSQLTSGVTPGPITVTR